MFQGCLVRHIMDRVSNVDNVLLEPMGICWRVPAARKSTLEHMFDRRYLTHATMLHAATVLVTEDIIHFLAVLLKRDYYMATTLF